MIKKILLVSVIFIASGVVFATNDPNPSKAKAFAVKTIIIDPGHGGIDPGARGLISTESQLALEISMKFGKAVQAAFPDVKIIYTRTSDILPGNLHNVQQALRYRAELANNSKADLYISIHCNAAGQRAGGWYAKRVIGHKPKVVYSGTGKRRKKKVINTPIYESYYVENKRKGTETYIWAADRSDDKEKFVQGEEYGENVVDTLNILDLNSPEARIRAQLYTKYFFRNSAYLAYLVEDMFKQSGRDSYGVKQRNNKGIWVLQATGMPSILVETGFITNKEEEEYLNSDSGQAEVVNNILDAFTKYKQEMETPKGASGSRPAPGTSKK
ncbi:MAG: N-acetylmuramoyl-L-alanine amidase [Gemmatimonadaceae bacterium]|nr:N-acetylmuramoyl-L-alanine amidase [Chitinophagaceae bacterium]